MAEPVYGQGADAINTATVDDGSSTPVTFLFDMRQQDSCGVVLATERQGREVPIDIANGDNVVASTKVWTLGGGSFTGADVGAVLRVNGSTSNDGTFTITVVTDSQTVTTSGTPADETFTADVNVFLIDPVVTGLVGAWTVQVINDFTQPNGMYDAVPRPLTKCHPADITTQFTPDIAAVASSPSAQYVQATLAGRAIQFTFTPDGSGGGTASVYYFAKSYS